MVSQDDSRTHSEFGPSCPFIGKNYSIRHCFYSGQTRLPQAGPPPVGKPAYRTGRLAPKSKTLYYCGAEESPANPNISRRQSYLRGKLESYRLELFKARLYGAGIQRNGSLL